MHMLVMKNTANNAMYIVQEFCFPTLKLSPRYLIFFFHLNDNFQMKKFNVKRRSFDRNLFSPSVSRDMQKHLFDLYISQIVTVLAGEI